MAGFEVVEHPIRTLWMPIDYGSGGAATVYLGQLVVAGSIATCSGGVKAWNPAGEADTTADQVPWGVVVGLNKRVPTYSSSYSADYDTAVQSQANLLARDYVGAEGMWGPTDPAAMAQIAVLGPNTVLKGRIFNAAWGTAPTVTTVSTGSATGAGYTASATEFTAVAYNATYYCRTGANAGLYRVSYDTSATVKTFYTYFPYDIAIGDTFVGANIAPGTCKMMLDTAGTYIDNAAAVGTTNWIWADVFEVNLKTAGREYAIFRINPIQYAAVRAA